MRKTAIATSLILTVAIAVFVADMVKQSYWEFASIKDVQKLIPNTVPPQFAKVLDGNDKDCLTKPNQTKPVSLQQIKTLRQLTSKDEADKVLGNAYCQTATGFKYVTDFGKELTVKFNKVLDYGFSNTSKNTLTNRDRAADRTLLTRPPEKGMVSEKESGKTR